MIVGVDVGGTKTHVLAVDGAVVVDDFVVPTSSWVQGTLAEQDGNAARLLGLFLHLPGGSKAALVVGAHGLDSDAQVAAFDRQLERVHGGPFSTVNDVELVGPAAGLDESIQVIIGTGSKVVGRGPHGELLDAGGYGYLIGDPASAPALAREAVQAVLSARDRGEAPDLLARMLMAEMEAEDIPTLAFLFGEESTLARWASLGPLVFDAADGGSSIAAKVIDESAAVLAEDVRNVAARGARGDAVVCAGGVVTHQPRLFRAFEAAVVELGLGLTVTLLTAPPVQGAVELGRRLVAARSRAGS